jgi:hypothetical protein
VKIRDSRETKHLPGSPNFRDPADAVVALLEAHSFSLAALGRLRYLDMARACEVLDAIIMKITRP